MYPMVLRKMKTQKRNRVTWFHRKSVVPSSGKFDSFNLSINFDRYPTKYLRIILWDSEDVMHEHIAASDGTTDFSAMCQPHTYTQSGVTNKISIPDCIATLHFVKYGWTLDIVVHEVCHFIFFLARVDRALSFIQNDQMDVEEEYTYLMGDICDRLYRELWTRNQWGCHVSDQ